MFRLDLICLTNSWISAARMTSVSPTIASAQDHPDSGPNTRPNTLWNATRTTEVTKYSGLIMNPAIALKNSITQAPRVCCVWLSEVWPLEERACLAGTGSTPPAAHGWHRATLRAAYQLPRRLP